MPSLPKYKLLFDPDRFPTPDLTTPVSEGFESQGLGLSELDNLAFEFIDTVKLSDLTLVEIENLALQCRQEASIDHHTLAEVEKMAQEQLTEKTLTHIHTVTLKALACMNMGSGVGVVGSAMKAVSGELEWMDREFVNGHFANIQEVARLTVNTLGLEQLKNICKAHLPNWRPAKLASLTYGQRKNFAVKRLVEEKYFAARVQVIRVLAEKRIAELQVYTLILY